MDIRRLNVDEDYDLYKSAFTWESDYPRWLIDAEKVARLEFDEFVEQAKDRADIGVFDPEFTALISVLRRAPKVFEAHVWAKRGTKVEGLGWVGFNIRRSLEQELGMEAAYVWIADKNRPVKRLCRLVGFQPDGAVQIDGMSHGRPIKWIRLSCQGIQHGPQEARNETGSEYELQQR